jgi:hypothetical protein
MSKAPGSKSNKTKAASAPKTSSPDKLTRTGKKGEIELSEGELDTVSGGISPLAYLKDYESPDYKN